MDAASGRGREGVAGKAAQGLATACLCTRVRGMAAACDPAVDGLCAPVRPGLCRVAGLAMWADGCRALGWDLRVDSAAALLFGFAGRTGEPMAEIAVSAASTRTMIAVRFIGERAERSEQLQCRPIRLRLRVPKRMRIRPITGGQRAAARLTAAAANDRLSQEQDGVCLCACLNLPSTITIQPLPIATCCKTW